VSGRRARAPQCGGRRLARRRCAPRHVSSSWPAWPPQAVTP